MRLLAQVRMETAKTQIEPVMVQAGLAASKNRTNGRGTVPKLYIKQDSGSAAVTVACRVTTDDDPQIQLVPGKFVKVATLDAGTHILKLGTIVPSGIKTVKLTLGGGTHNGSGEIEDDFHAPTDGTVYEIVVPADDTVGGTI